MIRPIHGIPCIATCLVLLIVGASCTAIMEDARLACSSTADYEGPSLLALPEMTVRVQVHGTGKSCVLFGPVYIMIIPCSFIKEMGVPWSPESLTVVVEFDRTVEIHPDSIAIWLAGKDRPMLPIQVTTLDRADTSSDDPPMAFQLVYPLLTKKLKEAELRFPTARRSGFELAPPTFYLRRINKTYVDIGMG